MAQSIRSAFREQINRARSLPFEMFEGLLNRATIEEALDKVGIRSRHCVYTPLVALWTFVNQVLDPDHSCQAAVSRLIAYLTSTGSRRCSANTGAYRKARQRLPLELISQLVYLTGRKLDESCRSSWKWKGRNVHLLDGTTVTMPDTPANQKAFPHPRTQKPGLGFPIARMLVVISLSTGAVRRLAMGPYKGKGTGESSLLRRLWDHFEPGSVVVGDRGFGSFFGIAGLRARGVDSVCRLHQSRKSNFTQGSGSRTLDHIVTWRRPTRPKDFDVALYNGLPEEMAIREVGFRVNKPGFRVRWIVLATTLLNAAEYTLEDLAGLYFQTWTVEVDLRTIKVELSMNVLRCKTPDLVAKEAAIHMLVYNLVRTLMAEAAVRSETQPRKLSFKGAMQAIRAHAEAMRYAEPARRETIYARLLEVIAANPVGNRPGRVEPRAVKRRPKPARLLLEPRDIARKRLLKAA